MIADDQQLIDVLKQIGVLKDVLQLPRAPEVSIEDHNTQIQDTEALIKKLEAEVNTYYHQR